MRLNQWMTRLSLGLVITSGSVFAADNSVHEQLQVPSCLAAKLTLPHVVLAENKQFKIIDVLAKDLNEITLLSDKVQCGRFTKIVHHHLNHASLLFLFVTKNKMN